MSRTIGELRAMIKDMPDEGRVWAYEGEVQGIVFSLYGESNYLNNYSDKGSNGAFLDNENPEKDEQWLIRPLQGSAIE